MAEPHPSSKSIEAGYELSDLSPRSVTLFAVVLALVVTIVIFVTYSLVEHFHKVETTSRPAPAFPEGREPVARPRFWVTPQEEVKAMKADEDKMLQSYGWVDKQKGIARIPIDEAMKFVAKEQGAKQGRKQQ